jgi:hypothetical protein
VLNIGIRRIQEEIHCSRTTWPVLVPKIPAEGMLPSGLTRREWPMEDLPRPIAEKWIRDGTASLDLCHGGSINLY